MLANAPMSALVILGVLFLGCLGVTGYSEWIIARPVLSVLSSHPSEAISVNNLPVAIFALVVEGSVTLTARQSGWRLMRTSWAIWQRTKLVQGEF